MLRCGGAGPRPPAAAAPLARTAAAAASGLGGASRFAHGRQGPAPGAPWLLPGSGVSCAAAWRRLQRRARRRRHGSRARVRLAAGGQDQVNEELAESLWQRTMVSLDFDYVLARLRDNCYTVPAQALAEDPMTLLAHSADEVRALYSMVEEMAQLEDTDMTLEDPLDIEDHINFCAGGGVLEKEPLIVVAETIRALLVLRTNLEKAAQRGVQVPQLLAMVDHIDLPDGLLDAMLDAFTEDGELSIEKFPELQAMRDKCQEMEKQTQEVLRQVLSSGKYSRFLAEDGYMQFGDRYLLQVRPKFASEVGVIVDETRSGKIVYCEPKELTEITAKLQATRKELKFYQRRLFSRMCVEMSRAQEDLRRCIDAASSIDLARARLFLGEDIEGEIPEVGEEGIIMARHARNPALLLREGGARTVGYRLELGSWAQGIILSGPNAGGKTVVLKTLGLLALLARCGIPVPAGESPRVDFFEVVLAEVGDMQTIVDNLSTYSAHLVASKIILSKAAEAGPRSLILVDEAGTGTDPAQGAAMARAVLEELLDVGARMVATTHCMQLKNWAMQDSRTEIAAMEYKEGRPTYRLIRNAVGESHAIEVARGLELPASVTDRAEELLGEDQRSLLALQREAERLEKELKLKIQQAEHAQERADEAEKKAKRREAIATEKMEDLNSREASVQARQDSMRNQLSSEYQARVKAHEKKMQDLVAALKSDSGRAGDERLQLLGDAVEDLKLEQSKVASEAAKAAKNKAAIPGALTDEDQLSTGEWVVVLARTPWYGFKGQVSRVLPRLAGAPVRILVSLQGTSSNVEMLKSEVGKTSAPPPKRSDGRVIRKKKAVQARDYSKMNF